MFKLVTKQTLYNSVLILTGYITAVPFFLFFFCPTENSQMIPKQNGASHLSPLKS